MVTLLVGCVGVIALATALVAFMCILEAKAYDDWLREFHEKGIQTACWQVVDREGRIIR